MLDLFREIAQTLRSNRLRTALTGLAVAWGIFMLIILLGAARGVVNAFHANADGSDNRIQIWGGMTTIPYQGYREGRPVQLRNRDIDAIRRDNSESVASVIAFARVDTAKIYSERDVLSDGFTATYPRAVIGDNITMVYGRFINERDMAERRRVLVISDKNARLLFGDEASAVGRTVRCLDLAWTVVGVFNHMWRSQSYAPYSTYKAITGDTDEVFMLQAQVQDITTEDGAQATEDGIRASLAQSHGFDPADRGAVWVWNSLKNYLATQNAMGYLNIAVWIIGIFTLLSGIVGVSNIMFVSVRERTHEIGIRRAIGAKPRSILMQVLSESVAVTALFGYIGMFLGMVVLQILDAGIGDTDAFRNPTVDISIAVEVTIALIIAGAAAGLFPALKAIKVKPVEALRDE